jgi:hypothetical protein
MTSGWALTQIPRKRRPAQGIEHSPGLSVGNRIDPDQHAVELQQLFTHLVRDIVCIDGGLGVNAQPGQLLEDATQSAIVWRRAASRLIITAPKQRELGDIAHGRCGSFTLSSPSARRGPRA